jgi:SulP family sulfate permease
VLGADGNFFPKLRDLLASLGETHVATLAVGVASVASLLAFRRFVPRVPGTLIVLVSAIVVSALLGLDDRGVDVVGDLPRAVPDPAIPDVSLDDVAALVPAALGVMVVGAEAIGVARALALKDGYRIE